jgi:type I restriction enzyme M protein
MRRKSISQKKGEPPPTTAQALGSLLKSARDIMRKDKGLNGDLDRLPLLTWIMFLKFLDDLELQREEEALLSGGKFRAAIEAPYRWNDWAANPQGITGDELLAFINQDEAVRQTARADRGSLPICARSPVQTAMTGATLSRPCSAASITG